MGSWAGLCKSASAGASWLAMRWLTCTFSSLGGSAGGSIYDNAPPTFAATLAKGVVRLVKQYGFDGVDLDIEHRFGDIEKWVPAVC